jgi:hypothetical protein
MARSRPASAAACRTPASYAPTIAFADGARESLEIDLANPNSGNSWRLVIGAPAGQ